MISLDLNAVRDKAIKAATAACQYDKEKRYEDALNNYVMSIEYFQHLIKYEKNAEYRKVYKMKAEEYLNRAMYIKKGIREKEKPSIVSAAGSGKDDSGKSRKGGEEKKYENFKFKDKLFSTLISTKHNVIWDDVAGLEKAKSTLHEAVILPTKLPQLFVGKIRPWKGILLYGPPGSGKSHLVKACATEAMCTFFSVNSSDLFSKGMDEPERLIKSLFEMARANRPAIIFIEKIDSLASSRSEGENDTARRIITELLVQINGVGKEEGGLFVLGATNVPWKLDPAVRRRFEKRIYIPLPEEHARAKMFKLNLGNTPNTLTEDDFHTLALETSGYSGSDIAMVVKEALMEPIRKCQIAKKFRQTPDGFFEPTSISDCMGFTTTLYELKDPSRIRAPKINLEDMIRSLAAVRPSVAQKDLERQEEWTAKFGPDGS